MLSLYSQVDDNTSYTLFSVKPADVEKSCTLFSVKYLLYGYVSQGLGTTKFLNLIGWNGYWLQSRFSHLDWHLDRWCFEEKLQTKMQDLRLFSSNNIFISVSTRKLMRKKVKRTRKLRKNWIRLITARKQNVSYYKPVTLNKLNCSCFCRITRGIEALTF